MVLDEFRIRAGRGEDEWAQPPRSGRDTLLKRTLDPADGNLKEMGQVVLVDSLTTSSTYSGE